MRARLVVLGSLALVCAATVAGIAFHRDGSSGRAAERVPQSPGQSDSPKADLSRYEWQVPVTADGRQFAKAFATAIWTYDTRLDTYEQWRLAVGSFADPDGPPASADVARALLPVWQQWDELAGHGARAAPRVLRVDVPPEIEALRKDGRVPVGWQGFVVSADQAVTADGRTTVEPRHVSVAVVCSSRCFLWSATPETPQ